MPCPLHFPRFHAYDFYAWAVAAGTPELRRALEAFPSHDTASQEVRISRALQLFRGQHFTNAIKYGSKGVPSGGAA